MLFLEQPLALPGSSKKAGGKILFSIGCFQESPHGPRPVTKLNSFLFQRQQQFTAENNIALQFL